MKRTLLFALLFALTVFSSCGGGGTSATVRGFGSNFTLASVSWGRLAEILDADGNSLGKKVISPSLDSDSTHFTVSNNPITEITEVQLIPVAGTALYQESLNLLDKDSSGNSTLATPTVRGPDDSIGFGVIPSNAALKLQFNVPVDFSTVSSNTIKFLVGSPPTLPFYGVYYPDVTDSSVVIFKPTISNLENIATGLSVNPIGFPRSTTEANGNLDILLPIVLDPLTGQNVVIKSSDGQNLAVVNNPINSITGAINRRYRSGGDTDSNGGFLIDSDPPQILGTQSMTISSVLDPSPVNASRQRITFSIDSTFCQDLVPVEDDVLVQGSAFGLVKSVISTGVNNVVDVLVLSGSFSEGAGFYKTPYEELVHGDLKPCFVSVTPINSAATPPTSWLNNDSTFTVEFSEPINTSSVLPFRTFAITNRDVELDDSVDPDDSDLILDLDLAPSDFGALWNSFVVGEIFPSADRKSFRFEPLMDLNDTKTYDLHIVWGDPTGNLEGIRDLAGNALDITEDFRVEEMTVDPSEPDTTTNVRVFRFKAIDLDEDGISAFPETNVLSGNGQGSFAAPNGGITGRNATPYRRIMDDTQTFIGAMNVTPSGLQTPFVPLGARMMTLYRYHDVFGGQIPAGEIGGRGPNVNEKDTWHVDVKGFSWSPFGGNAFPDAFDRLQILMGHSLYSPIVQVDTLNTTGPWSTTGFNNSSENTGTDITVGSGPRRNFVNQAFETARYIRSGAQIGMGRQIENSDPDAADPGFDITNTVLDASPFIINPSKMYRLGQHDYIPFEDGNGNGFSNTITWRDLTMTQTTGSALGNPFLGGGYADITSADINLAGSICGSLNLNPIEGMDSTEFCRVQLTPTRTYNFNPTTGGGSPSASFPSIALPLLMEFRCYPGSGVGGNGLATSFMYNTNQGGDQNPPLNQVTLPASRIFSQGYRTNTGFQRIVSPANASVWDTPRGGFSPSAQAETASHDPTMYWGVLDLQNRTSVFFSRWFDTGATNANARTYGGVVIEPSIGDLPAGTDIVVEFRAATSITTTSSIATNANNLDPYGNCNTPSSNGVFACTTSLGATGLTDWTSDITSLAVGKRYLQMRVRLISNAETNLRPTVKGIGIVYQ